MVGTHEAVCLDLRDVGCGLFDCFCGAEDPVLGSTVGVSTVNRHLGNRSELRCFGVFRLHCRSPKQVVYLAQLITKQSDISETGFYMPLTGCF